MVMVQRKNCWSFFIFLCVSISSMLMVDLSHAQSTQVSLKKCLKCHPALEKEMASKGAHAPFKNFECSSCHNPHTSNYKYLVKEEIGKLCKSCHKGKKRAFGKKYGHSPFEEGACLKCHKPHSSKNRKLLLAAGEKLCFTCHAKKEILSKKYKHDPVKKGKCLTCHSPHTSDHEGMLKRGLTQVCASCHSIKTKSAQKSHNYYPVRDTKCTSCHNPHASSHSDLIKESSHKPFAERKCTQCHNSVRSRDPLGVKGEGMSVCAACHPSIMEDFRKVNTHVGQGVFCTECHNPHASDQASMIKGKEARICTDSCHLDTKEHLRDRINKHKHPLVMEGKCSNCHRPHGSNFRLLYRADEISTCADCHKRHGSFTHPIGKDAIDPRSKGEITCVTCHNLMGSRHDFALRFDRNKELCIQCHKGY